MSSIFRNLKTHAWPAIFGAMLLGQANATTSPGLVTLTATVNDFAGSTSATSGQRHDAVVWVTKADGTFVKTLWKQGPAAFDDEDWVDHFGAWNTSRAGSTALDGFSGATSQTYAATVPNNPITVSWNCRDASNNLVEDGDYKFFIQYAESKTITVNGISVPEQGPVTAGLTWTKGPASATTTPPNEGTYGSPVGGSNFTNLQIVWNYATVPPTITSSAPATGTMGTPYNHAYAVTGSSPITFAVTAGTLPPGLNLTSTGVLSGIPTASGFYNGTVTAQNGVAPNAPQFFSIAIAEAIVFTSPAAPANGNLATNYSHDFTVIGTGPVTYSVSSGALPPGLVLSSDGKLTGKPTQVGTYTGKVSAHNGIVPDVTQDFSIVISTAVEGSVTLTATISEYAGTTSTTSPSTHYTVVWVTNAAGKFIKTLWKQGPTFTHKDWSDHFVAWNTARAGSTDLDGFTSPTAADYLTPNNPVSVTWNCRDAAGNLVDDGNYNFYIQYGESQSGVQGPLTTALTWTKGSVASSLAPAAQGTQGSPVNGNNFTNLSIVYSLVPEITVLQPSSVALTDGDSVDFGSLEMDTVGTAQTFTITNAGSADLTIPAISIYGEDAADFAITPPSSNKLAPAASATFTVTFKPGVLGTTSAALQIASNDADESPFDIQLTGTGTPPPAPEIEVTQPAGSSLVSGTAKKSFGTVKIGKTSAAKTFTIKNVGTATLTDLIVLQNGRSSNDFFVSPLTKKPLLPGETSTFKVTFKPRVKGARSANLNVLSNDADENPFVIKVSGEAVK